MLPFFSQRFLRYEFDPALRGLNRRRFPQLLGHTLICLSIEFIIILAIIGICYMFLLYAPTFMLISIYIIAVLVILILIFNMMASFRIIILYEFQAFFRNDIFINHNRSPSNISRYRFLAEHGAMSRYKDSITGLCAICQRSLNDNGETPKYTLHCGHIYHTQCLNDYENHYNINIYNEFGRCPLCRGSYHFEIEKFRLNEIDYFDQLPIFYKDPPSYYLPIQDFFEHHLWIKILPSEIKKENQQNQCEVIQQEPPQSL